MKTDPKPDPRAKTLDEQRRDPDAGDGISRSRNEKVALWETKRGVSPDRQRGQRALSPASAQACRVS